MAPIKSDVVVIVGASGGIGQTLVDQYLRYPNVRHVYGLSRQVYSPMLSDGDLATYEHIAIDYNDEDSIALAAEKLPIEIDRVIVATGFLHGQGVRPEKTFKQLSHSSMWQNMLVNVVGPSLVAKHLLPKMRKQKKTVFAALSARVGSISDNQLGGWYAYRSSKAALNMMIKTFAVELKRSQPDTIIVGLHPGTVDTELSKPFQRNVAADKLFTRDFSASQLIHVVENITVEDSGYCFAWDGQKIPE